MNKSLLLKNCLLFSSQDKTNLVDLLLENGKISSIGKINSVSSDQIIDVGGRIIAPGLIDVHIQGAGGSDVLDGTEEALLTIAKTLAKTGTTSYLGTTVVKPETQNHHLKIAKELVNKNVEGATLLGFHLEGPFINPEKKGALNPTGIYPSSSEALKEVLDITNGSLSMMTIAPEMPGNLEIIKQLKVNGVIPAFAHSNANYDEAKKGFEAGINHVTHIFNAMSGLHHRDATALNAIFENETVTAQIISDGHHLHKSTVNMLYKILGSERCICITDGIQAIGLPEGRYFYNGREYESKSGAARYLNGTLIGSAMSLLEIIFKFKEFTGCTLEEAINSASKHPAKLLGLNKGEIAEGKDADLIIIDNNNSVYMTIIHGKVVYSK
jgi:N-acetylglucosamine-6-phosphate deacetylase